MTVDYNEKVVLCNCFRAKCNWHGGFSLLSRPATENTTAQG